jgi:AraC-like DNA-binding protein/mannose-6-phosphate isomerase-like protein (cupin superfamily)
MAGDNERNWMQDYTFTVAETFPQIDFPLTVKSDPMLDLRVPEHSHEFSEVVVVTAGRGKYRFGDITLPAEQGDVFVISPGERHALVGLDQMHLNVFMFLREPLLDATFATIPAFIALFDLQPLLRPGPAHQRHLRLDRAQLAHVTRLHYELAITLSRDLPMRRELARAQFHQVIALCCQAYELSSGTEHSVVPRLATVVSYMHAHLTEPMRLADLADVAGCSANQLGRLFQLAMQQSPMAYVMQRRLEQAAAALRTTRHSVTANALDCGFSDGNYFSKQFKKHFGMSPRQWRGNQGRRDLENH